MKKILSFALILLIALTTFSFTGCSFEKTNETEISFEEERENKTEENKTNEKEQNEETNTEENEEQKSIFYNKEKFNLKINDIYCAVPTSYSIFLSSTKAVPLTTLPETLKPDEMIEFDIKIDGAIGKIKLYNMDSNKECKINSADVVYLEFDTDKVNFDFYKDLDGQCTRKEILNTYGPNESGNASLELDLLCYKLPANKIMFKDVYVEFTVDIQTQKTTHFRYGVFTPEYLQEEI